MSWSKIYFGKHKGKTLPQVVFSDPDWFFWAIDDGVFDGKGALKIEAKEIYKKATSIRIPEEGNEELVAEYGLRPSNGTFCDLEIVPKSRPPHEGSTRTFRLPVIDLSVPRRIKDYDKLGCRLLISTAKFYLFGDSKRKMTKKRCEEFFSDDSNFDI